MKRGKLSELQDLLRVGAPTPSGRTFESEAKTVIAITLPDGSSLNIQSDQVTIEFSRDFVDVTRWTSAQTTYMVDKGTFTIKGKL